MHIGSFLEINRTISTIKANGTAKQTTNESDAETALMEVTPETSRPDNCQQKSL